MKIKLLIIAGLSGVLANFAFAQLPAANANFVFTLPGTLTPTSGGTFQQTDTFSFSIRLNYPGPSPADIESLSYFFQVPTGVASFITITTQSINDGSTGSPSQFNQGLLAPSDFPQMFDTAGDPGVLRNTNDLGGIAGTPISPTAGSTFYIATLSFQLTDAPVGMFSLQTTTNPPTSVSNSSGAAFTLAPATYTVNVVPEPGTWPWAVWAQSG
jgi:hypothetical protein